MAGLDAEGYQHDYRSRRNAEDACLKNYWKLTDVIFAEMRNRKKDSHWYSREVMELRRELGLVEGKEPQKYVRRKSKQKA